MKKKLGLTILMVIGITMLGSVSAYDRIPFKYHNAEGWSYQNKYTTNVEHGYHEIGAGIDWSNYMTWDFGKPIDTLKLHRWICYR